MQVQKPKTLGPEPHKGGRREPAPQDCSDFTVSIMAFSPSE